MSAIGRRVLGGASAAAALHLAMRTQAVTDDASRKRSREGASLEVVS